MEKIIETREEKVARWESWLYAVKDEFKSKTKEEIREHLQKTKNGFSVMFSNVLGDFNIGTGIRNANAFNANNVYYFGNKRFDKRGACGSYHYLELSYLSTLEQVKALKEKYHFVALDNFPGAKSLYNYEWKSEKTPLLIFGEEGSGISKDVLDLCDDLVEIPMYGSVRSLNVGTASGIVMNDFVQKKFKV
jgi:tRNA G18 (ribose-2'-O)-methylase SpoU